MHLLIARTGLLHGEAQSGGFDALTVPIEANDHKAYYPGAVPLHILVSGDRSTGRLLGAQIVGSRKAEISKRIDTFAVALFHQAAVEDLNDLALSYTPPFSSLGSGPDGRSELGCCRARCDTLSPWRKSTAERQDDSASGDVSKCLTGLAFRTKGNA
jgi:Pyridine nucleotide-disulphide oxidoreductase, dimerisation domain